MPYLDRFTYPWQGQNANSSMCAKFLMEFIQGINLIRRFLILLPS